jgi:hypothetical protein
MQDLFNAMAGFSLAQLLTSLAVLTPLVGVMWLLMRWAYDTRIKNLEAALADFRSDFQRRLEREVAKASQSNEQIILGLNGELLAATNRAVQAEQRVAQLEEAAEQMDVGIREREFKVQSAEDSLASCFDGLLQLTQYNPDAFAFIIFMLGLHPEIHMEKIKFDKYEYDLEKMMEKGDRDATYVAGRLVLAGRLWPHQDGQVIMRKAKELGSSAAARFVDSR